MTLIYEPHEPTTYYVDGIDGNDLNDGLSHENAFATIQTAVDAAYDGDTVFVADGTYTGDGADGTYTGDGNRDIEVDRKGITIRSENGPENCIIDCNGSEDEPHTGFYLHGISSNSNLSGFTVTNGYGPGGGILCNGANVTIYDCNISNNTSFGRGATSGGISLIDGIYSIHNCTISGNTAKGNFHSVGGIYCRGWWSEDIFTITDCIISGNYSGRHGGGISCYTDDEDSLSIKNCTITGNEAHWGGGGIYCDGGSPTITNCVINGNKAGEGYRTDGGGIFCCVSDPVISNCTIVGNEARGNDGSGGGICCYGGDSMVSNCILWNNTGSRGPQLAKLGGMDARLTISYNDIEGGSDGVYDDGGIVNWLEGNIDADPCFADSGFWDVNSTPEDANDDFWIEGDYHLRPSSACVDAGDPCYVPSANETDLDGNPRITAGRIDMGAYEFSYIESRLRILPQVINRHSRMKRIMAWVHLPEGVSKEQVDEDEGVLLYPGGVEPVKQYVFEHGKKGDKRVSIFILYDKAELLAVVPDNGLIDVQIIGSLNNGRYFYGSSFLTIVGRRRP
jgi:hypothetical protein